MELLTPSFPPETIVGRHLQLSSSSPSYTNVLDRTTASESSSTYRLAEVVVEGSDDEPVFVAVGKSVDKVVALLQWTFHKFRGRPVCLIHVHQPSPTIPTLLGKLPAYQANPEIVARYRKEESEKMMKLLDSYLSLCHRRKVKASKLITEAEQVQIALIDLIAKHHIRKLVMGAIPENCMRVKRSSSKANFAAKNAPSDCEIWFVHKGKNIWTREAFECNLEAVCSQSDIVGGKSLRSKSMRYDKTKSLCYSKRIRFSSSRVNTSERKDWILNIDVEREDDLALPQDSQPLCNSIIKSDHHYDGSPFHVTSTSGRSVCTSFSEQQIALDSYTKVEEEILLTELKQVESEVEKSKHEAYMESIKREHLEDEAMNAIIKAKDFEAAYALEAKLKKDAEDTLRATVHERDRKFEKRLEVTKELQKVRTNVAVLSSRVQEADSRCNEAEEEALIIQASIANLRQEKQNLRMQTMEADFWLARWRSNRVGRNMSNNGNSGFLDNIPNVVEFSLLDLQTATCNFSNSFKLGEGGYGRVYKGELLNKTVSIKQLHVHDIQGPSQFLKEVQVLGKIRHPHLVTLIGACPEGWALVYDYVPNGSLHNSLFNKSNAPLPWKDRTRIISEISCALLFLHSTYPEKIVHGDLKPENILLDSELRCRICDFGICRLVTEETLRSPSFRRCPEPKSAFPYTDPEFPRNGVLTPKSDVYSFGMIILQLLTGRSPWGLVADVRKAVSQRNLASILDPSVGDWPAPVADKLAQLGLDCCKSNSHDRLSLTPTVVRDLQKLHISEERPLMSYFLCPILQEIMLDPVVAADGHTYEREALSGWLENGRETSPMTNLPLSHLHLAPNHTLRRAIQDWLCKP